MAFVKPAGVAPRKLLLLQKPSKKFAPTLDNLGLKDIGIPVIPRENVVVEKEIGRGGFGQVQFVHGKNNPGRLVGSWNACTCVCVSFRSSKIDMISEPHN